MMWYALVEVEQSQSIRAFARANSLDMVVTEREPSLRASMKLARYYAHFADTETKEGPILRGEYGNGNVPEDAIADYAARISGKLLVVKAYGERREIQCPNLA